MPVSTVSQLVMRLCRRPNFLPFLFKNSLRMKIALVNLCRVNNAYGGTEKVFFDMANNLSRRGHAVFALVHDTHRGHPSFPIDSKVDYRNCKLNLLQNIRAQVLRRLLPLFSPKNKKVITKIKNKYIPRAKPIRDQIESIAPDIIISFQPVTTYLLLDVMALKTPVISMLHFTPNFDSNGQEFQLYRGALAKSAVIQVLLPEFANHKNELFNKTRFISIPNIVPQYPNLANTDGNLIINVARLSKEHKRQHLILEAFSLIRKDFPNWRVELWGETNEHPRYTLELTSLIRKHGMTNEVKICGPTNDVKTQLQRSSIFCFPSAYEGFSLALTEAMSIGLPVIGCKDCISVSSIVKDGENGLLAENTAKGLASKLRLLMSDADLRKRLGNQAHEDMKQYSPEMVWDQWENLIFQIVSEPKQCPPKK